MPSPSSFRTISMRLWRSKKVPESRQCSRNLSITCEGKSISREELFQYTHGRFLVNEDYARNRRYVRFDVDRLCAVAAAAGASQSPICAIEKLEGGFSKALLMRKEDESEVIAKIPFPIAGPAKYTTASEVAVLQYVHQHTQVPVPQVLAWSSDASNPVGAEYIVMEKAPGSQLGKQWDKMSKYDHFLLVKQLAAFEGEMTRLRFPANGSLYLRESLSANHKYEPLHQDMDPSEQFCVGPSCEREWFRQGDPESLDRFNRGPWPDLSSFGVALAEREIARLERNRNAAQSARGPPRGSVEEQFAMLRMAKETMSRLNDSPTLPSKVSEPTLWHTDLHMGNIYVSDEEPPKIVSIIDWQSIVVSPLYLQARFPIFLPVEEDYELGTSDLPNLPEAYDQMSPDDQEEARDKNQEAMLAKVYEVSSLAKNLRAWKALQIPRFLRELFIRCGEASEEGVVPLREILIEVRDSWQELGFVGECPINFTEQELQSHAREFAKYEEYHKIQELPRKLLSTDSEGWIPGQLDFAMKSQQNRMLLDHLMLNSAEYNMSPQEIFNIYPFCKPQ